MKLFNWAVGLNNVHIYKLMTLLENLLAGSKIYGCFLSFGTTYIL